MKNNILYTTIAALLFLLGISACRKMDDFKDKYLGNGAITYAGKIDSVKACPGDGRIMLKGLMIADPKIVQLRIYWDNKSDSLIIPITRTSGVDTIKAILSNMPESVKSFALVTVDKYGNKSIEVNITGRIYGAIYKSSLLNRTIQQAELKGDSVLLDWNTIDPSTGAIASELLYTDKDNAIQKKIIKRADLKTVLSNYKAGTTFNYRTLFQPDTLAIDTFYTAYKNVGVKYEITKQYIKNPGPKFLNSSSNGRWQILADWYTSADVKNAGGFGGIDDASWLAVHPAMSMEAGWGLPAVPNGKIYQTVTLPAGRYLFEALAGDCADGISKYITVAAATTLPDIANVPAQALKYMSIIKNTTNQLTFELTEATQVSIGFQAKLPDTGTFIKIFSVKLYSLP